MRCQNPGCKREAMIDHVVCGTCAIGSIVRRDSNSRIVQITLSSGLTLSIEYRKDGIKIHKEDDLLLD